jgi:hypothetical protein
VLDRDADGSGVREWLVSLGHGRTRVAVFDTRFNGPAVLRGRASKAISRTLRKHGFEVVAKPESFFVNLKHHLEPGEEARAQGWAIGSRQASCRAAPSMRTVRDDHPRPGRRDGRGDDPYSG